MDKNKKIEGKELVSVVFFNQRIKLYWWVNSFLQV